MKNKLTIQQRLILPIILLGVVALLSNALSVFSIHNVNANASKIVDNYMVGLEILQNIRYTTTNIHKMALSHIVATGYDTMIMVEEGVKTRSPFWLLKHLEDTGYQKYDSNMLMTFISHVTNNFIRHKVRLSNGLIGQIVLINKFNLTRPLIQIGNSFIDLSVRKDIGIQEILD